MKFCPQCGSRLEANNKFCPGCGINLQQQQIVHQITDQPVIKQQAPGAPPRAWAPVMTAGKAGSRQGSSSFRKTGLVIIIISSLLVFFGWLAMLAMKEARKDKTGGSPVMTDAGWSAQTMAMAASFRKLAGLDFNTLFDMAATPECRKAWNDSSSGLFSEQIEAAAFFDTAFIMVPQCSRDSFTVIAYCMWIDSAITARYEKKDNDFKISELKVVSISAPELITTLSPAKLEQDLKQRLARAAEADFTKLPCTAENSLAARKALVAYCRSLRDNFSPESKAENNALKRTVISFLEACRKPDFDHLPSPIVGIQTLADLPQEWRASLHPVYLGKGTDKCLVAFSSQGKPGRWLFAELQADGQSVKVKSITIGSISSAVKESAK